MRWRDVNQPRMGAERLSARHMRASPSTGTPPVAPRRLRRWRAGAIGYPGSSIQAASPGRSAARITEIRSLLGAGGDDDLVCAVDSARRVPWSGRRRPHRAAARRRANRHSGSDPHSAAPDDATAAGGKIPSVRGSDTATPSANGRVMARRCVGRAGGGLELPDRSGTRPATKVPAPVRASANPSAISNSNAATACCAPDSPSRCARSRVVGYLRRPAPVRLRSARERRGKAPASGARRRAARASGADQSGRLVAFFVPRNWFFFGPMAWRTLPPPIRWMQARICAVTDTLTDVSGQFPHHRAQSRVKRMHERGSYDRAAVFAVLDAGLLCHVAYTFDGQPYCTPTIHWREDDMLYWHGSSASRMLRQLRGGTPACLAIRASRRPGAGALRLQSFGELSLGVLRHCADHRRSRGKARAAR